METSNKRPMNVLITGISGFVGSHLAELALSKGATVYGICRGSNNLSNICDIKDQLHLRICNLIYSGDVDEVISKLPLLDRVFHLAAQSFVPASWDSPSHTMEANAIGQINLFQALYKHNRSAVIQVACSSEQYGNMMPGASSIDENHPFNPKSPYAVSKITQEYLAKQYYASHDLATVITRAFNHTGPRRSEHFVVSNFCKQIAQAELDNKPYKLKHGNLSAIRDFTDVRDMVRAYWLATEKCDYGVPYNIASGVGYSISSIVEKLADMADVDIECSLDSTRLRPADIDSLVGNSSVFRHETGWAPEIPFDKTLEDTLNYWRNKCRTAL